MKADNIINTQEIFKVEFEGCGYHKLMVQTYTDKPPFYYILKEADMCPAETADNDINKIISFYKRSVGLLIVDTNKIKQENIKKIYCHCLLKEIGILQNLIQIEHYA